MKRFTIFLWLVFAAAVAQAGAFGATDCSATVSGFDGTPDIAGNCKTVNGGQAWFTASGVIDPQDTVLTVSSDAALQESDDGRLWRTQGAAFGPGFDPDDVQLIDPRGLRLSFEFDSCSSGVVIWEDVLPLDFSPSRPNWPGIGAQEIARLTPAPTECEAGTLSPGHSGAWYVPSRPGEGWLINIGDRADGERVFFVAWFTYAP